MAIDPNDWQPKAQDGPWAVLQVLHSSPALFLVTSMPPDVDGSIRAMLQPIGDYYYHGASEAVTRGSPLAVKPPAAETVRPKLTAKDLIAELKTINGDIHRMMAQVERAVAKLAMSG